MSAQSDHQHQTFDPETLSKGAEQADRSLSEGQWALVWREFRKRTLALVAGVVIIFLITVSTFAPFCANDRPIWYSGVNHFEYKESRRTVGVVVSEMARKADTTRLEAIGVHIDRMCSYLSDKKAGELRALQAELAELSTDPKSPASQQRLREIRVLLRRTFDDDSVDLVPRSHWPVVESLNGLDCAFMAFNVFLLTMPLWRWVLRRLQTVNRITFIVLAVVPVLVGLGRHLVVSESIDRTNYKLGVLAENANGSQTVAFHAVLWPLNHYGLDENNLDKKYLKPMESRDSDSKTELTPWDHAHVLGTDGLGRDILCRMIWGGRVSLSVGVVAVSIYVTIGVIVGSIAGYFRGWTDLVISRVIEVVICFPSFFLILTIIAFRGPSIFNIMLVIGLIGWTGVARLVRGEFLRLSEQEFVLAGRSLGYSAPRLIFRHILPNAMAPVLVSATFGIAGAILTESALSFLGIGITVPKPSWGGILSVGRGALFAPWITYFPGIAIFLTITSYNLVGEALRDAADPRLRGSR